MAWSTVKLEWLTTANYYGDETMVTVQESLEIEELEDLTGGWRYPQPYVVALPNRAVVRVDFTGDVSVFNEGDLEFSFLNSALGAPIYSDDWALVVTFKVQSFFRATLSRWQPSKSRCDENSIQRKEKNGCLASAAV